MIPKKIDRQTASEIKSILQRLSIYEGRVLIDLEKDTVEVEEEDYSVHDLLEAAGTLTPDRAAEVQESVKKSREEWD